jgi:2,3-bisphosphoglycerate-dependent phosphoglycerate mutase
VNRPRRAAGLLGAPGNRYSSGVLYLVRHCAATGQEPDAPLTDEGARQAEQLAGRLADALAGATPLRVVSSPYRRAVESIRPLAERLGAPIETDARLRERVLSANPTPDWRERLRASYDDPDLCFEGGESSRSAIDRAVAALDAARGGAGATVVVTHGNLLSLILRHLDGRDGLAAWEGLTNPDVFRVADDAVERLA